MKPSKAKSQLQTNRSARSAEPERPSASEGAKESTTAKRASKPPGEEGSAAKKPAAKPARKSAAENRSAARKSAVTKPNKPVRAKRAGENATHRKAAAKTSGPASEKPRDTREPKASTKTDSTRERKASTPTSTEGRASSRTVEVVEQVRPQPRSVPVRPGESNKPYHFGYVALVGPPNVGKSTLMNRFLEQRLAIVTPKPQTTRRRTLGILSNDQFQMVLLDTPGLMDPAYRLHHAMLKEAEEALKDADLIVYLTDPSNKPTVIESVQRARAPKILAINKTDRLRRKEDLLPLLTAYHQIGIFEELVPISALHGDGVGELLGILSERLPEGPPLYPPDQLADQSERFFVAELVRERIFALYQEEVPYSAEVEISEFKERSAGKDYIEALVFVESDSQKRILIGKGGHAIKALGEEARIAIEEFLGREVFLSLRVRVLAKWRTKEAALRRFGYRT